MCSAQNEDGVSRRGVAKTIGWLRGLNIVFANIGAVLSRDNVDVCPISLGFATPIDSSPIDANDLFFNFVQLAEVVNGLTARRNASIVVNNHIAPERQFWI